MPRNTALRFKSGKGKSIRIDKLHAQKRREVKGKITKVKTICFTFLLFIGSIGFLISFFVYKNLNQNFAAASSYTDYSLEYPSFAYLVVSDFDDKPITLKKLNFVVLDKVLSKAYIFEVPLDVDLNLSGKYTGMTFEKLFLLGGVTTDSKLDGGFSIVSATLFRLFGFDVSNFIIVDNSLSSVFTKFFDGTEIFPFGGLTPLRMKNSFDTNYSLKDFYQVQQFLSSLPAESIIHKSLTLDELQDSTYVDSLLSDMTISSTIAKEKKTVAVLNGTSIPGIATLGSRVISNIGGRVVDIENASSEYKKTILVADDLDSQTVAYIKKSFGIEHVYTKQEASFVKEDAMSRSDIVLVVGFDLADRLY